MMIWNIGINGILREDMTNLMARQEAAALRPGSQAITVEFEIAKVERKVAGKFSFGTPSPQHRGNLFPTDTAKPYQDYSGF